MSTNQWLQPARDEYPLSTDSLHATHLSRLHGGHDVIGSLEVLKDAVLELCRLILGEFGAGVTLLEGAVAANAHHGMDELSVALHRDSFLIHV